MGQTAVCMVSARQPVDRVERLRDVLVDSTGEQQFRTVLLSAFALVGLALALVGIYGVTAAAVKARTWETGVRMALGASPFRVVLDMIAEAGRRVLAGTVAGMLLFIALGRLTASLLYQTSTMELRVMVLAIAPLAAASMLVSYLQARRLASVSPVSALRDAR